MKSRPTSKRYSPEEILYYMQEVYKMSSFSEAANDLNIDYSTIRSWDNKYHEIITSNNLPDSKKIKLIKKNKNKRPKKNRQVNLLNIGADGLNGVQRAAYIIKKNGFSIDDIRGKIVSHHVFNSFFSGKTSTRALNLMVNALHTTESYILRGISVSSENDTDNITMDKIDEKLKEIGINSSGKNQYENLEKRIKALEDSQKDLMNKLWQLITKIG